MTGAELSELKGKLRDFFASTDEGLVAVYLYGSTARAAARPESDVDVALLFRTDPPRSLDAPPSTFRGDLEALFRRPVDVVVLNRASADLCHRVFRDGEVLVDRDRAHRLRFEVRKRSEYLDLLPVLRRYRRYPREEARS